MGDERYPADQYHKAGDEEPDLKVELHESRPKSRRAK
jgi:hypothetical protein